MIARPVVLFPSRPQLVHAQADREMVPQRLELCNTPARTGRLAPRNPYGGRKSWPIPGPGLLSLALKLGHWHCTPAADPAAAVRCAAIWRTAPPPSRQCGTPATPTAHRQSAGLVFHAHRGVLRARGHLRACYVAEPVCYVGDCLRRTRRGFEKTPSQFVRISHRNTEAACARRPDREAHITHCSSAKRVRCAVRAWTQTR